MPNGRISRDAVVDITVIYFMWTIGSETLIIVRYRLDSTMEGLQDIHLVERSPVYVLKIHHRAI